MKVNNKLFIVWGIIVFSLIILLGTLGILFKNKSKMYEEIENNLKQAASSYVDHNFLYPEDGESLKITSDELIKTEFLKSEELKLGKSMCTGYVNLKKDLAYNYSVYIKCPTYVTRGYKD